MTDRDKMISEIGASLIRDISCQSCAALRAELEVLQERADSAAADRD